VFPAESPLDNEITADPDECQGSATQDQRMHARARARGHAENALHFALPPPLRSLLRFSKLDDVATSRVAPTERVRRYFVGFIVRLTQRAA